MAYFNGLTALGNSVVGAFIDTMTRGCGRHHRTNPMLVLIVASGFIISRLWIITQMNSYFNTRRRHQFHILDSLPLISIKNNNKLGSVFPSTSGQIPPTSGHPDWSDWDPHD